MKHETAATIGVMAFVFVTVSTMVGIPLCAYDNTKKVCGTVIRVAVCGDEAGWAGGTECRVEFEDGRRRTTGLAMVGDRICWRE